MSTTNDDTSLYEYKHTQITTLLVWATDGSQAIRIGSEIVAMDMAEDRHEEVYDESEANSVGNDTAEFASRTWMMNADGDIEEGPAGATE